MAKIVFLPNRLDLEAAPYTYLQSQRDCVLQPRVASNELPWGKWSNGITTPTGLRVGRWCWSRPCGRNPVGLRGCFAVAVCPRVARKLATLGFEPESLWDSAFLPNAAQHVCKEQR